MKRIGPYQLKNNLFLAPMVGVSDTPYREICSEQGAGLTIAEMLTCNSELWHNKHNRLKQIRPRIDAPHVVQIAGSDPQLMADAAEQNMHMGADAIDINMGCPAKKVLKKAAGSALLRDTALVQQILEAVVARVNIPVTLKIRTGWSPESINGVEVARIAEDAGVQLLTVHGRTRECRFNGIAEYDTIAAIKQAVAIPVIANGDIDSPEKAAYVQSYTGVDGLMIGRAAQGRPWIFREIEHYLATGSHLAPPSASERLQVILRHLQKLHLFYGELKGVWYARKHVSSYLGNEPRVKPLLTQFNRLDTAGAQIDFLQHYFEYLSEDFGALAA